MHLAILISLSEQARALATVIGELRRAKTENHAKNLYNHLLANGELSLL
jgi:hypothetical protein